MHCATLCNTPSTLETGLRGTANNREKPDNLSNLNELQVPSCVTSNDSAKLEKNQSGVDKESTVVCRHHLQNHSLLGHYNSHLIEHVWVKRLQRPACHFLSFLPIHSLLSCAIKAKNDKNIPFLRMSCCFLSSAPVFTLICTKADAMHNESQ